VSDASEKIFGALRQRAGINPAPTKSKATAKAKAKARKIPTPFAKDAQDGAPTRAKATAKQSGGAPSHTPN